MEEYVYVWSRYTKIDIGKKTNIMQHYPSIQAIKAGIKNVTFIYYNSEYWQFLRLSWLFKWWSTIGHRPYNRSEISGEQEVVPWYRIPVISDNHLLTNIFIRNNEYSLWWIQLVFIMMNTNEYDDQYLLLLYEHIS